MKQQLENIMETYRPMAQERQQTYFVVGDLESLSASALYTPKITVPQVPIGPAPVALPKFISASKLGLGPGIASETESGYIERYRAPEIDETHGEHLNLLSYLPGKTKPFLNIHIDLNDK